MTMRRESQHVDRKSLRFVTGAKVDFGELAQDCVCFANGAGDPYHRLPLIFVGARHPFNPHRN